MKARKAQKRAIDTVEQSLQRRRVDRAHQNIESYAIPIRTLLTQVKDQRRVAIESHFTWHGIVA